MGNSLYQDELHAWKQTIIFILRRWLFLFFIIAATAGIFGKMRIDRGTESSYVERDLEELQQTLVKNENMIQKDEANIVAQQNTLKEQERTMASYRDTWDELSRRLEQAEEDTVKLDLTNRINAVNSSIMSVQAQISNSEQAINNFESEVATLKSQNESLMQNIISAERPLGGSEIAKSMVMGSIVGFFAGVVALLLWYMLSGRLQELLELEQVYGYDLLGEVYTPPKRHRLIARMLDRWEGYPSQIDIKKEYELIAGRIELLNSKPKKKLALTGTIDFASVEQVAKELECWLPKETYTVVSMKNPVYDVKSLRELKEYAWIVVEKKNFSQKTDLAKLTRLLNMGKVEIQGAIGI